MKKVGKIELKYEDVIRQFKVDDQRCPIIGIRLMQFNESSNSYYAWTSGTLVSLSPEMNI